MRFSYQRSVCSLTRCPVFQKEGIFHPEFPLSLLLIQLHNPLLFCLVFRTGNRQSAAGPRLSLSQVLSGYFFWQLAGMGKGEHVALQMLCNTASQVQTQCQRCSSAPRCCSLAAGVGEVSCRHKKSNTLGEKKKKSHVDRHVASWGHFG